MKVVAPEVYILYPFNKEQAALELGLVQQAARTCYRSEAASNEKFSQTYLENLIRRGHESPLEHAKMTVQFIVDRGVANELVRHRIASYSQESTRYCNYSKDKFGNEIQVVDFTGALEYDGVWKDMNFEDAAKAMAEWSNACREAEKHYLEMIKLGVTPQIARGVLPLATRTELIATMDIREWRHFFKLRAANTTGPAHPQMQEIARKLLIKAVELYPVVFDDIFDMVVKEEST